jgi:hypothetical protein
MRIVLVKPDFPLHDLGLATIDREFRLYGKSPNGNVDFRKDR